MGSRTPEPDVSLAWLQESFLALRLELLQEEVPCMHHQSDIRVSDILAQILLRGIV